MHITFVSPRYGATVHGGAEMAIRMLANHLAAAGHEIEVHSTTAADMATWANEFPAGATIEDGVSVHRHRTVGKRHRRFDSISAKVLADPAGVSAAAEMKWIEAQGPHSPDLIDAVDGVQSDVIVFSPYLYEPTLLGVPKARVPVVIHPASHDEAPLRLPAVRHAIESADGLGFYTDAERRLTERVIPAALTVPQMLVGVSISLPPVRNRIPKSPPPATHWVWVKSPTSSCSAGSIEAREPMGSSTCSPRSSRAVASRPGSSWPAPSSNSPHQPSASRS